MEVSKMYYRTQRTYADWSLMAKTAVHTWPVSEVTCYTDLYQ